MCIYTNQFHKLLKVQKGKWKNENLWKSYLYSERCALTTLAGIFYELFLVHSSYTFIYTQLQATFYTSCYTLHINSQYWLYIWETPLDMFRNSPALDLHEEKLIVFEEKRNFISWLCCWSSWKFGPDKPGRNTSDF